IQDRAGVDGFNDLDHFGSSFFVFEVKGSQKHTKNLETPEQDFNQSLSQSIRDFRAQFSCLDWEYMEDRTNGELLCDVGVTINAQYPEPLVGLWRLDWLEGSYGKAGYQSGEIHHLNTLSYYGALAAEQPAERAQRSHVQYRCSYNLAYEVVRSNDNSRNLFLEKDLYNLDKAFLKDSKKVQELYRGDPKDQHYGVRDEYRISGSALRHLEEFIDPMTKAILADSPILWIRSSTWFEFLARRLGELTQIQELIFEAQLPNHGILSGLMSYLMQSVVSTPTMVNSYVRESLALLNFKASADRH
ncbi:hypothetical protein H0H93_011953, partial [Arthromyces matolae]